MTQATQNLYFHFAQSLRKQGDKVILLTGSGQQWSGNRLDQLSAQMANLLTASGLQPGDRVSAQVNKSPEALCLYLACLRGGFVFHPLNTGYRESELRYFLSNAGPALLVCDSAAQPGLAQLARETGVHQLMTLNADGSGTLTELATSQSTQHEILDVDQHHLAALLYSSGTTGVPKGIMLSHGNLLSNTQTLVKAWEFTAADCLLHALPIFHVHGLFVAVGCALLSCASMRWLQAFDAREAMKYLPDCSVMMGVPTFYTRLLDQPDFTADLTKGIRVFISGSAPLLPETFEAFEKRTGQRILERYGMTETNMNSSNPLHGKRRAGTVGLPLPGIDIRITDDNNQPLPTGEIGAIQVRGPNVFQGYWQMPEKTAEDFTADGFFNTGDKGFLDEQGYLSLVGRAKDMIITGGLNVYPKELELIIDKQPHVLESAVIGVPHPDFGEAVVAVLIADKTGTPDTQAIHLYLKDQLAGFKVPKALLLRDELPRNTMGKVQKNLLRADYNQLFKSG